ncbi:Presenilins-associated rhomboid-like protein mitochondrial [Dissostichus eleginoides]|uniref:rhomboid protease n=1 Tax=Dissostichus eleginoides TaxID=100907 RepID=A0AAD9CE18_DISEL|nr:Presenilins-associated rhomboid-like protein mitochondrial [Dissostichus eleginoides]
MAWRSCSVLLRLTGEDALRSSARGGSQISVQQRCNFRKVTRKPEQKGEEHNLKEPPRRSSHPQPEQRPPPSPPRDFGLLLKPLVFTVGFTGCSFGAAAIWQYESLKFRVQSYFDEVRADWLEKLRPQKRGNVRKEINQWWNSLSEGQRTVTGIIAANAIVFCCWRIPSLRRSMLKYFTADPASKTLCAPMLLSTFSHFSFFHLAVNMYVLWSFSSSAVSMLGREQFIALYLSAGVISSFFSYFCKTATGRFGPSLGAKELKVCLQKELKVCLQKELKVRLQKEHKELKVCLQKELKVRLQKEHKELKVCLQKELKVCLQKELKVCLQKELKVCLQKERLQKELKVCLQKERLQKERLQKELKKELRVCLQKEHKVCLQKELKVCLQKEHKVCQKELKECLQKELKVCLQKELKSGAIMTILAAALKAIVAMDTAGIVLGWQYFDHAAHLGGALFGIWYIMFGHELIWKNREPFVKLWHELRTGGGRGGGGGGEGGPCESRRA